MASASANSANRPYFYNGQALAGPPMTVRVRQFFDSAYIFMGLYVTTLLSFEPYAAAEASSFNQRDRPAGKRPGWGFGGGRSSSGGGGGPGGPGGGSGGKKLGGVDDIRGPECKSCG